MKKHHITLSDSERLFLKELLSKGSMKVRKQTRIKGLLYLDEGKNYQEISKLLSVNYVTVSAWASSYKTEQLSFLDERPRSGRPVKFDGQDRAKVTALACSDAPEGYSQWSLRLLSDRLVSLELVEDISYSTVGLILKKTNYNLIEKDNGVLVV
ncbi:MAG: helix-turn-helix domain-containing protein [Arcicella sp.]|nr:helix-turn-helix domain-containing protein [Arcicella sp.]